MEQRRFEEIIQKTKESYPVDRKIVNHAFGVDCVTGIEMEEINVIGKVKAFTGDVVRVFSKGQEYDEQIGIVVYDSNECPMIVAHEWRIPYAEILKGYKSAQNGGLNLMSVEILIHFNEHHHFAPDILEHPKFSPFTFV